VVEHPRFFLGEDDHPPCSVGESLEQQTASDRMLVVERSSDLGRAERCIEGGGGRVTTATLEGRPADL
jgi:hypothetical protein